MKTWLKRYPRRIGITLAWSLIAPCVLLWLGISAGDAALMRNFAEDVTKWTTITAPRKAALDYSVLGSATCRARFLGIPSADWTLFFRKAPGLPASLAVNETSQRHYELFKEGPIAAYFHLLDTQDTGGVVEAFATLQESNLDLAALREAVEGFDLAPRPIAHAGTTDDLRQLLRDINPRDGDFMDGVWLVHRLHDALDEIGREHGWGEVSTWDQTTQAAALYELDTHLKRTDPFAWRSKQLLDYLVGICAQVYGRHYLVLIEPSLVLRSVGMVLVPLILAWITLRVCRRAGRAPRDARVQRLVEAGGPPAGVGALDADHRPLGVVERPSEP